VKIGLELKKLVFKRKLGGGEFSYVSFATGEERRGKSEILELLKKESGWNNLLSCKSSSETEFSFMKKVKKQISFVLFEDQAVEATLCKNVPDADSGSKEHEVNCDLPNATIEVEDEPNMPDPGGRELNANANCETSKSDLTTEVVRKKRKRPKAGPASKVKRLRSESPVSEKVESSNDAQLDDPQEADDVVITECLDATIPFEGNNHEESFNTCDNELEKTREYFEPTASPVKAEEIQELPDSDVDIDNNDGTESAEECEDQYSRRDEDRRVLVFKLNKAESHSSCKSFFAKFDLVEHVKRSKTRTNSFNDSLKYKGVYLITFKTEEGAEKFLRSNVVFKGDILPTILLSQYNRDKFFQRCIQRSRVVQSKHESIMILSELRDLKKRGKLENCVSIQIPSVHISYEQVQEYFCGISSDFIDNFGKPVEQAYQVGKHGKGPFLEYILVFEMEADAKLFVRKTEVHKFEDLSLKVLLLTDSIKRIKFSQKPKNFIDDKQFSEKDNIRRVAVQTVNNLRPPQEIEIFFHKHFPSVLHIHRCEINSHFIGLYILSFENETDAKEATKVDCEEEGFVKNLIITQLDQYLKFREKYLNMKSDPKKKAEHIDKIWKVDYKKLEEIHKENHRDVVNEVERTQNDLLGDENYVSDFEEQYNTLCDRIDQNNSSDVIKERSGGVQEFSRDVFIGCKGIPNIDERSKTEIEEYFYENHENVEGVVCFNDLVFVKFSDPSSANRFFTLNYIMCKGCKVTPFRLADYFESVDHDRMNYVKALLSGANSTDNSSQNTDDEIGSSE